MTSVILCNTLSQLAGIPNNTPKVTCDRLNPAKAVSFGASCEAVINLKGRMRSGKRERSYAGFHTATAESEAGKQPSEAVNTVVFPLRFRFAGRLRAVIGPLWRQGVFLVTLLFFLQ